MTIRTRLLFALCGLFLCTLLNAVVGFVASKSANYGLQSIHDGRVVALRDLKIVADMYAVNIVDASHKVRNGNFTYEEGLAAVLEAKQKIERHWSLFSSVGLRQDNEEAAFQEAVSKSSDANAMTDRLLIALQRRDATALDRLVRHELYQTIDPISEAVSKLVDLQLTGASATFGQTEAAVSQARWVSIAALAAAAVTLMFALWTTLWGTIRPLEAMTLAMRKLAEGDLSQQVPGSRRRDEIGRMAAALEIFKANAAERLRLEHEAGQARKKERLHQEKLEGLIFGFRGSVTDVLETVSQGTQTMSSTAAVLTRVASDASDRATSANRASTEASASVQTVAVAAEELVVSIQSIASQMQQTSAAVHSARELADQTDADVAELTSATERVGKFVVLIRSIADQTNLLALNAAIEAARAGEAGRGFAVVASEVKQLAKQTASATDEIAEQVSDIQLLTSRAVAAIEAIRSRVGEVNELSTSVATALVQQKSVTEEITQSMSLAAQGSREVAQNVEGVASAIIKTSTEARQANNGSSSLADAARSLSGAVDSFLHGVAFYVQELGQVRTQTSESSMMEVSRPAGEAVRHTG